ncbi:MAG: proprotein convertase P-domain-containing protein [Thiolinea sp.]
MHQGKLLLHSGQWGRVTYNSALIINNNFKAPLCSQKAPVFIWWFNFFFLLWALGLMAPAAHAASYSNSNAGAIPDNDSSCSNALTRNFNVPDNMIIGDVNFGISIQHEKRNDLEIYLKSPSGKEIVLMSAATSPSINVNYLYDDEAAVL